MHELRTTNLLVYIEWLGFDLSSTKWLVTWLDTRRKWLGLDLSFDEMTCDLTWTWNKWLVTWLGLAKCDLCPVWGMVEKWNNKLFCLYCFVFHLAGKSHAYFVSGMLVKRITRAIEECKLDITLACFLCKSTLRTSSVIGGHAPHQQNYWGAGSCAPSSSASPATSLKIISTIKQWKTNQWNFTHPHTHL